MRQLAKISTLVGRPAHSGKLRSGQLSESQVHNMTVDSKTLFTHGDVVRIQHHGEYYLLRHTRLGKLILTK